MPAYHTINQAMKQLEHHLLAIGGFESLHKQLVKTRKQYNRQFTQFQIKD